MMAFSASDLQTVYGFLRNALSQDENIRKPAEAALFTCQTRPGFCSCLAEIISTRDIEDQSSARWLASVYIKNSINRFWRHRRESFGISDAEKAHLRGKLLDSIREENNQVAQQIAQVISKIARFDYPKDWPNLFPFLIEKLKSSDGLAAQRSYMVLNRVLKELSTKRLTVDQRNFAEITSQLFDYTWHNWCSDTEKLLNECSTILTKSEIDHSSSEKRYALQLICERWLLSLKALRRMIKFGFQSDAKYIQEIGAVKQVCSQFIQVVQSMMSFRKYPLLLLEENLIRAVSGSALPHGYFLKAFVETACLKLLKILVEVQSIHPYSFSDSSVLPPVLDFTYRVIMEPESYGEFFEAFSIYCMILIQAVVQCKEYRPLETGRVVGQTVVASLEDSQRGLASRADAILKTLLDNERLLRLCNILVGRYFTLAANDLDEWASDPETFHHTQDMMQWKDKLRPCAESLYLSLFENYREILGPLVVEILKQASESCPPALPNVDIVITQELLLKEAAYNAVGIANYDLHDLVDFKLWFESTLSHELENSHPNGRILRRRVAWLFGQWVSKITGEIRRPIYIALLKLLGDGDMAVQLAACRSMQHLIDDVNFYEDEFVEFVPPCLDVLIRFMRDACEFDSKLQVFNLISLIIDRLGEKIIPCTQSLISFLPQVWQDSEGQSLLRIQVMVALQRLVVALGPESPICYNLLLPILDYSTDIGQPDELNMLEDGLQLWQISLKHARTMVAPFLTLFPHLVSVMERNLDHVEIAMNIIESYLLLGGHEFLSLHAAGVVKIMEAVVGNVKEKGMLCTLPVIDILILCFPKEAPPLLEGILRKLLLLVINGSSEPDSTRALSGAILARVLIQNGSFFEHLTSQSSLISEIQQPASARCQNVLILFFDAWLEKVDFLTSPLKRKLCAAALCIFLTVREPQVLDRLDHILSMCSSVLNESKEERNGLSSSFDYLTPGTHGNENASTATEDTRKRMVLTTDPINTLDLAPFVREKLETCASLHGQGAFNAALSRLHPSILNQLQQVLAT